MKALLISPRSVAVALVTCCFASSLAAQDLIRYAAKPVGSKCEIIGTSSLPGEWTMESSIIGGSMEVAPGFPESALTDPEAAKPKTTVNLPVRTFKSGRATMDDKMQEAMQVNKFPRIEYELIELKPISKPGDTGPLKFEAVGALKIIGNTVTNTMPVTIEKTHERNVAGLKVVGVADVKMSAHKMEAPRLSLPLVPDITVRDDLKIKFEWQLVERPRPKVE